VLAGHSFGGLYVQTFAANYPDQVAGLVLLDSTAPKPGPALPTRTESYSILGRISAVFSAVAHLGAGRLIAQTAYGTLPPHFRGEARANASTAPFLASWIEESGAANTSMQQAASLTTLDGKPLVVVTADTGNAAGWEQAQDKMATLSTNSSHRVAKDTTHRTLLHDETDSAHAIQAIHDVVRSVRTGSPLAQQ
jgi:pimeloyl-ACP methyl ester carboxylesterase